MKSILKFTFLLKEYPMASLPSFFPKKMDSALPLFASFTRCLMKKTHVVSKPGPTWESQCWCHLALTQPVDQARAENRPLFP